MIRRLLTAAALAGAVVAGQLPTGPGQPAHGELPVSNATIALSAAPLLHLWRIHGGEGATYAGGVITASFAPMGVAVFAAVQQVDRTQVFLIPVDLVAPPGLSGLVAFCDSRGNLLYLVTRPVPTVNWSVVNAVATVPAGCVPKPAVAVPAGP